MTLLDDNLASFFSLGFEALIKRITARTNCARLSITSLIVMFVRTKPLRSSKWGSLTARCRIILMFCEHIVRLLMRWREICRFGSRRDVLFHKFQRHTFVGLLNKTEFRRPFIWISKVQQRVSHFLILFTNKLKLIIYEKKIV